jgi:hypothetical protein
VIYQFDWRKCVVVMFEMFPTDDLKSYAVRLSHYGVIGGLLGLALVAVLVIQNFYLIYALRSARRELRTILRRLNGLSARDDS